MIGALLALASRAAWAAPVEAPAERPLRVKIDVSALAKADAPHIERFTLERLESLLAERSYTRADDAGDAIEIRFDYLDKKDLEYAIYVDVFDDGKLVKPGIDWFVCKFCPQTMLADTVAKNLPAALDRLEQAEAEAAAEAKAAAVEPANPKLEETPSQEPSNPRDASPKPPRPIGWLGITGVVVASGGLATTIAGAVQLAKGEVAEPAQGLRQRIENYRPQGVALVSIGVSAVVIGTAAVVADVLIRKKQRNAVALAPSWLPRGAGVAVSVRF